MDQCTQKSLLRREKARYALYAATRICLFLLLIILYRPLMAQQPAQKLNANYVNVPLKEVFAAIEKQTGYVVNYSQTEVNAEAKVTVRISQATIREFLAAALKNTAYQFSIDGNIIIIKSKPRETLTVKPGKITGKIIDEEDGRPVIGATIQIGDKTTTSNIDGSFSLSLPKGVYTAAVSSVGYGPKNITNIEVKDDRIFSLDLTMKKEKGQLTGVVVTASATRERASSSSPGCTGH